MAKPDLNLLLGRRIIGVVLKKGERPAFQFFLILDDGTYAEVYSEASLNVSVGYPGDAADVRAYMARAHHITDEAHLD